MTDALAIYGMAGRFAGADDVDALWNDLLIGQGRIRTLDPARLRDVGRRAAPPAGIGGVCSVGLIDGSDRFDGQRFGLTTGKARRLGHRERLLLNAVYEAIIDAGFEPDALRNRRVSIHVGAMRGTDEADAGYVLANRISHVFGFTGASQTVDAAHASALVALHQARAEILSGGAEIAIVAAVAYDFAFWQGTPPGVISPTGRCRVFAKDADGVIPSEGVGAIVLARPDIEAAPPRALLLGTALGHAGSRSSLGQPSTESQAETLKAALAVAGTSESEVRYVEAHGTGTAVGDPAEIAALRQVFKKAKGPTLVGSAKAVIGHTEAAAGMAGLIKAILALEHRRIPPHPNADDADPALGFGKGPLALPETATPLPDDLSARAVVTALGFGGVAADAVLAPTPGPHRATVRAAVPSPSAEDAEASVPAPAMAPSADEASLRSYLKTLIAEITGVAVKDIDDDAGLEESCGVDSFANQEILARLEQDFGPQPPTLMFSHSTVSALAKHLSGDKGQTVAIRPVKSPRTREPVAVVGIGGIFPGAPDKVSFWRMLVTGAENITEVPADRWDWRRWQGRQGDGDGRIYSRWGGFVDGPEYFDPLFFNLSPAQAARMDPQQRLFLQAAWSALEDAGHTRASLPRGTGVFVGASTQTFAMLAAQASGIGEALPVETDLSDIANRVSFFLDLHGPSLTVDTACSSSLTAVHLALRSLEAGDSEAAFVGGVSLTLHPNRIAQFCSKGMLTPEALCRPFGDGPGGFIDGEGACALLLKPLSAARADGDHIYGLLRGSAVNSGGRTSGYTVPDPAAQAALVRAALADAKVAASTISYVECHGTGTSLGDPIEIEGLTQAFRAETEETGFCAIGSLKANIGHLISAAGIAGLTKVLLQLDQGTLAPSINTDPPNPRIDFAATPFVVNRTARPWDRPTVQRGETTFPLPRRAGISSFGSGGSNAHVVAEEAETGPLAAHPDREKPQLVPLSARTPDRLAARVEQLLAWLDAAEETPPLADIAHTLRAGREAMKCRLAVVATSVGDLRQTLSAWRNGKPLTAEADDDLGTMLRTWTDGGEVNWSMFYDPRAFRRVPLPAYPFERVPCRLPELDRLELVATSEPADPLAGLLHVPTWAPAPLDADDLESDAKRVLIVSRDEDGGLGEAIAARHSSAEISYADDGSAFDRVYFLAGATINPADDPADPVRMEAETERGILSLFRLVKALAVRGETPPRLTVVTSDVHPIGQDGAHNPWHAAQHGLVKSLAKERAGWNISCLDVDLGSGDIDRLAEAIVAEPADPRGDETAHRGGVRYRRRLSPLSLPIDAPSPYREGGVYLIVGGAGGIGAAFSRHLAERHQARFVWIGRRSADAAIEENIEAIRASGGDAVYVQGDASDPVTLRRAAELAHETFGGLNGAVHSALILRDQTVARMEERDFLDALNAKTQVAAAMLEALRNQPLDFLVFFSSALSFLGFAGQSNYTAGCSVKDALAHTAHQPWPVVSLNWGYWREVGIVANDTYEAILKSEGVLSIPVEDALSVIGRVLSSGIRQVIPMKATDALLDTLGRVETPSLLAAPGNPIAIDPAELAVAEPEPQAAAAWSATRQRLEGLAPSLARKALATLEADKLGVTETQRRLFAALNRIAEAPIETDDSLDAVASDHPEAAGLVKLLRASTDALPEVLTGRKTPTEVLFPDGSMDLVAPFYRGNPEADWCNGRAADAVAAVIAAKAENAPEGSSVTVVEIGAGTGSTTAGVLARLKPLAGRIRYIYTDIAASFAEYGRQKFAEEYPFAEFRPLDIERHPAEQEFEVGKADLVLATNVLHATRDIRRTLSHAKALLTGGGWLVANEITTATRFTTLTFGLLDGWWRFEDETDRLPDAPLLAWPTWQRILSELGYGRIGRIGGFAPQGEEAIQNVVLAESNGLAPLPAEASPIQAAPIPAPPTEKAERPATGEPADRFAEVLGAVAQALALPPDAIDPDASFRDYGVDSISGITVIRELNRRLGTELPVTAVFDHPSVRALAAAIEPEPAKPEMATQQTPAKTTASATSNAVDIVRSALADALCIPVETVAAETDLQDLGLDRFAAHEVAQALSRHFDHPTDADRLFQCRTAAGIAADLSPPEIKSEVRKGSAQQNEAIAVIGMAGMFPGAPDLDAFWEAISQGRDCITDVPPDRWDGEAWFDPDPGRLDRTNCKRGGFVDDVDLFDPAFFRLSFREACLMDPQQRLFLEACWRALADGGYPGDGMAGRRCGIFAGVGESDYLQLMEEGGALRPATAFWGNSISALPARIAYMLDLRGPALAIDTACSSSLVAIHEAARSVASGECDMALAGGAHIRLSHRFHISASNAGMLSTTGRSAAFDDSADGFVPGEGVGAVLLKRLDQALADGDRIDGVILGSAINQDGRTNGLTAPSVQAQTAVEQAAYAAAGIDPATLSYIEAHGTGTLLGDPIEIAGLTAAFRATTERKQFCAIGSVKTNIGHAAMAAGVAGLMKVLLMMRHRQIPPSLHFQTPNRHIDFANSPLRVITENTSWQPESGRLRAAVSSFGMSGTNAHMVIEEAPAEASRRSRAVTLPPMNRRRCWFDLVSEGRFSMPVLGEIGGLDDTAIRHAQVRAEVASVLGLPPSAIGDDTDLIAAGLSPARAGALRRRLSARFGVTLPETETEHTLDDWLTALDTAVPADGPTVPEDILAQTENGLARLQALRHRNMETAE